VAFIVMGHRATAACRQARRMIITSSVKCDSHGS
jgi:hypothetical protein